MNKIIKDKKMFLEWKSSLNIDEKHAQTAKCFLGEKGRKVEMDASSEEYISFVFKKEKWKKLKGVKNFTIIYTVAKFYYPFERERLILNLEKIHEGLSSIRKISL